MRRRNFPPPLLDNVLDNMTYTLLLLSLFLLLLQGVTSPNNVCRPPIIHKRRVDGIAVLYSNLYETVYRNTGIYRNRHVARIFKGECFNLIFKYNLGGIQYIFGLYGRRSRREVLTPPLPLATRLYHDTGTSQKNRHPTHIR